MNDKQYFTTNELAKIFGVSRVTIFDKIKKGQIKAEKMGRNYIIFKKDIDNIFTEILNDKLKMKINKAIDKVIKDYKETLIKLGNE